MQGNYLYPISVNLQWRSMFFYICFSLSVAAHITHEIFGMIFESLVYCITGFPFWFFAVYTAVLTFYTKVLCITFALGTWHPLHSCTRINILINSKNGFHTWSDWDHSSNSCSQKHWMNTQDLDLFVQKSHHFSTQNLKNLAKAVGLFLPQNGTLKLSVKFSDHFHEENIILMRKTSGGKKQHKIDPAAFKLLENVHIPMVQFNQQHVQRRKFDCELYLTLGYAVLSCTGKHITELTAVLNNGTIFSLGKKIRERGEGVMILTTESEVTCSE